MAILRMATQWQTCFNLFVCALKMRVKVLISSKTNAGSRGPWLTQDMFNHWEVLQDFYRASACRWQSRVVAISVTVNSCRVGSTPYDLKAMHLHQLITWSNRSCDSAIWGEIAFFISTIPHSHCPLCDKNEAMLNELCVPVDSACFGPQCTYSPRQNTMQNFY